MSGKNSNAFQGFNPQIPYVPWIYFGLFLISNGLVSYFTLSINLKLWIVLFGVLLPFFLTLWSLLVHARSANPISVSEQNESSFFSSLIPAPSHWLWLLFILLLVITRFYEMTAIPFWPISDEGINTSLAIEQAREWHWRLLWSVTRNEPLFFWLLGAFFKAMTPSLFTVRFFSALISIAASFLAYWASRQFFPKSISFLFCWLYSFSFGALVMSRFCNYFTLVPFFLYLCFGLAGSFLNSKQSSTRWKIIILLGIAAGAGFYVHTSWIIVWPILALLLFTDNISKSKGGIRYFLFFVFFSIAVAVPLLIVRFSPTGMVHLQNNFNSFSVGKYFPLYATAFLWNGLNSFPYGPVWGGWLDPVSESLVLIGVLQTVKRASLPVLGWGLFCFFLTFLPGILSNNVELFRVIPFMVCLMVPAVLGLESLYSHPWGIFSKNWINILLAVSLGLNLYHYFARYCDPQLPLNGLAWRSLKYFQIHEALRRKSLQSGPLYVFSDFDEDFVNKTLEVASYPYNALENPALSQSKPTWAALLISMDDSPFLKKRFPHMENVPLDENVPLSLGLYLIPPSDFPVPLLRSWIQADRNCRELDWRVINRDPLRPIEQVTESFMPLENEFAGDSFLSSVFWEKIAFIKSQGGDARGAAWAYQQAVQKGIPAPHLFYLLGKMSELTGEKAKAE